MARTVVSIRASASRGRREAPRTITVCADLIETWVRPYSLAPSTLLGKGGITRNHQQLNGDCRYITMPGAEIFYW
jgi:hypothetical protein